MKVGICTLGCKVNTYESEYMLQQLQEAGYQLSSFHDVCDVYIINTCTVTNTSDIKSRKMIHLAKRQNPKACIVAVGCFMEANPSYQEEAIDIYVGTREKSQIVELLDRFFVKREIIDVRSTPKKTVFEDMYLKNFAGRCRAFVKIQDGCENFCSYCIIPYVRGKCRSKRADKVITEIKALVNSGYQEIVLTGIHTGNYGVDLGTNFANLLKEIVQIKGLQRLRISSIEVTELTEEVLTIMKEYQVIVDHLHIPLQAGSNHILKLMNRKYTVEFYEEMIKKIRQLRRDIAITTDIIVGFPGETAQDFNETLETAHRLGFAKIHVFPYSCRQGTKAMELPDHLVPSLKKERSRKLVQLSNELAKDYAEKFLGTTVEVLFEETKQGISSGHTSNYLKVKVNKVIVPNTFQNVHIRSYQNGYCLGEIEETMPCHIS